jgi:hypothetical protein
VPVGLGVGWPFSVYGSCLRVRNSGFRVQGVSGYFYNSVLVFRVWGLGFAIGSDCFDSGCGK